MRDPLCIIACNVLNEDQENLVILAADASPKEMKTCISMEEWIDVWGTIVGKAKRMDDFPMWLQYYPKVLFAIINRSGNHLAAQECLKMIECLLFVIGLQLTWISGTGIITKSELKLFYTAFMDVGKLGDTKLDQFTDNAYQALTSVRVFFLFKGCQNLMNPVFVIFRTAISN